MKRLLYAFLTFIFIFILTGCSFTKGKNDNKANIHSISIPFKNLSNEFTIKDTTIKTFFIDDGNVPYISLIDFISNLDGFFDCGQNLRYIFEAKSNLLSINYNYLYTLETHWDTNTISVDNYSFFSSIIKKRTTNYSRFMKYTNTYSYGKKSITFNLGGYHFDILYYKKECLIPFVIANMLFCSSNYYNIFYNGDAYYGYSGEISTYSEEYSIIHNSSLNGKSCPNDVRTASINSLLFAFDYFYGLKNRYDVDYFKNYIQDEDIDLMFSNDTNSFMQGYRNVLIKKLDELHTRIDTPSNYNNSDDTSVFSVSDYGDFRNEYYSVEEELATYKKAPFPDGVRAVRYYGDTAIITLNSFKTGSKDDLYDSNGYLKDTAWKYDSYYYMQYCMYDIKQHNGVKDILLDISQNGGGNMSAMQRVLGFITDNVLKYETYDTLTDEYRIDYYKIDTDSDGNYDDDAYNQYRWTLLTSINSFSAANTFTSCFVNQGLGRTIGQKTGGGMCTVLPILLADGTAIAISSNNTMRYVEKNAEGTNIFYEIENGINPNLKVPYIYFYTDEKLVNYIDQVYS